MDNNNFNNGQNKYQNDANSFGQNQANNGWSDQPNNNWNNNGMNQDNNFNSPMSPYNNAGFDPNQTYSNDFNNTQNNMNSDYSYGNNSYQPMDNNQYGYENQQYVNNPMSFGPDAYKSKATSALVLGILSCVISLVGVIVFFGAIASSDDFVAGFGVILSGLVPIISLILGIIGICVGASYHNKSKLTGNQSNKGKATAGIVISVISVILSAIATLSCTACVACAGCVGCVAGSLDEGYYEDFNYDDFTFEDFEDYL